MGYKLLGFVVWQVAKWYVRRHASGVGRKLAVVAGAGVVIGGVAAVAVHQHSSREN
jgi:hypothetical protein